MGAVNKIENIKSKPYRISVTQYKNGYRASVTIKLKNGTSRRVQKFSADSPHDAIEKVYAEINKIYFELLRESETTDIFSKKTDMCIREVEKTLSVSEIDSCKYNLFFQELSKEWLAMCVKKMDRLTARRPISNNTFEFYRSMVDTYLNKDFANVRIDKITHKMVQDVFDGHYNLKAKTLSKVLNILSQIMEYGIKLNLISSNPTKNIELREYEKPEIDFYTADMIPKFKDICVRDGRGLAMLFWMNISHGLRPEEGCGLKWNKINFSDNGCGTVVIDNAFKVFHIYDENHKIIGSENKDDILKTKESYRTIPLLEEDQAVLRKFKESERKRLGSAFKEDGYAFLNTLDEPYTSQILTNKMPTFLRKYQLPHITPYGLRHSYASYMAKIGVKESILKTIMGHSEISTTQKYYIHLTANDLIEEVSKKVSMNNYPAPPRTPNPPAIPNGFIESTMTNAVTTQTVNNITENHVDDETQKEINEIQNSKIVNINNILPYGTKDNKANKNTQEHGRTKEVQENNENRIDKIESLIEQQSKMIEMLIGMNLQNQNGIREINRG